MNIKSTDIVLVAGKRGSGKTTLSKSLLENASHSFPIQIIDPLNEYTFFKFPRHFIMYGDRKTSNHIIKQLFNKFKGMLVIDESDRFFPNRQVLTLDENRLIHLGRHYGLGTMFITRRLANLHTDVVSQANKLFIFKLWQRADLQYLAESGYDEYTDAILNLGQYEFVSIDTDTGETQICNPI